MQQHLPFTVLKQLYTYIDCGYDLVATALTVYGIETINFNDFKINLSVATALTVYGIETFSYPFNINITITLQQHLPFTVLKLLRR